MAELLEKKLDETLVIKSQFYKDIQNFKDRIQYIQDKLNIISQLLVQRKPRNYIGRIIISTTDDIESKVIKHYGGKRWKRVVNFLRGVSKGSEELDKKFGEEWVCLRESNIPNHSHNVSLDNNNNNTFTSNSRTL